MRTFNVIFLQIINRFFCKRNLIIYTLILLLSMIAVFTSINDYEERANQEKEFLKMEAENFKNLRNYVSYSKRGIHIFLGYTATNVLFANPTIISELAARIDTVATLDIYSNCQGKILFLQNPYFQMRLSSILLLLGSLLALCIGFNSLRDLEYLKFIASATSKKAVYIYISLSRFLLLIFSYVSILLFALFFMALKGIYLKQNDFIGLTGFFIAALLMLMTFFLLGTAVGSIKSQGIDISVLLTLWILLVLIMPGIFDSIIEGKANEIISYYKVYNDKFTVTNDFERKTEKGKGAFKENTSEKRIEIIEDYWNNYYPLIEKREEQHKEEIEKVIIASNNLYNLLPSTFYLSTANEASSRGYRNFLDFYTYNQGLRRQFLRFWIDRVYYNDPKIMVNFIKSDENIFKAKSQLPFHFWQGVFINFGYCIVLFCLSYFLYLHALFPAPKTKAVLKKIRFNVSPASITDIRVDKQFIPYFLNVFFGRIKRFSAEFILWGGNIVNRDKKAFLYIPSKDAIPGDLKVKTYLNFFKRVSKTSRENFQELTADLDKTIYKKTFTEIDDLNKTRLLLMAAQMKKSPILVIDNIAKGIPFKDFEKIKPILLDLKGNDNITIFSFSDVTTFPLGDNPNDWIALSSENGEYFDLIRK